MLVQHRYKVAGAGDNYIALSFPEGTRIKLVCLENNTTQWLPCWFAISNNDRGDIGLGPSINPIHRVTQQGDRHVIWEGDIKITGSLIFVVAKFEDCVAADELWVLVGYEKPERRGFFDW